MKEQIEYLDKLSLKAGGLNGLLHFIVDHVEESEGLFRLDPTITSFALHEILEISKEVKEMIDTHQQKLVFIDKT